MKFELYAVEYSYTKAKTTTAEKVTSNNRPTVLL